MLNRILQTKFKYLFFRSYVRTLPGGALNIASNASISKSHIVVGAEAMLEIGPGVSINNASIFIKRGRVRIEDDAIIGSKNSKVSIYIEDGDCMINSHAIVGDSRYDSAIKIEKGDFNLGGYSKFAGSLIWIRFGGGLKIGEYTNINHGTEIRCDKIVKIGSFCQISYNIRIWDTNTHEILSKEERRKRTIDYFPTYGKELSRPQTKPVIIGDDCWIGENCSILKGSEIGNECILGYHTFISGKKIPSGKTVYNSSEIIIK